MTGSRFKQSDSTKLRAHQASGNSGAVHFLENGPEFISKALDLWAYQAKATIDFSRPGKPTDNAYIESFNGSFRDECFNVNWFLSMEDARVKIEAWRRDYNSFRPHSSLADKTPEQFMESGGWVPRGSKPARN